MMTDMTTQQKDKMLATAGFFAKVCKGVWWLVKVVFLPIKWLLDLMSVPKGTRKPMSLPGKIMTMVFAWGLIWFINGFDGSGFLRFLGYSWDALLDGRLVF